MKVALIIPAYNAMSTLPRLLQDAGKIFEKRHILVIDDGSTDDTTAVVQAAKVPLRLHPDNRGKGAALCTGFEWALENEYDAVITMDADGQHEVSEIPKFLAMGETHTGAVIIGSRMDHPVGMPRHRRLSNITTSRLLSWRTGRMIRDSQCGFRFIPTEVLRRITLETTRFQMESELLIKASQAGFAIECLSIRTLYNAPHSSMRLFADTWRFVVMMIGSMAWKSK